MKLKSITSIADPRYRGELQEAPHWLKFLVWMACFGFSGALLTWGHRRPRSGAGWELLKT